MTSSPQKQAIYPDEDLKALNFVRRSILRKNEVIYRLQEQLKQMQEEVVIWKKKFHAQEKQFGQFSSHSQDIQDREDVGNLPHGNTRARKARIKAETIHNDEQFDQKRAAGELSSPEIMNSISRVGQGNYVEMETTEEPYAQQPEFEEPNDVVQYDDSGLCQEPLKGPGRPVTRSRRRRARASATRRAAPAGGASTRASTSITSTASTTITSTGSTTSKVPRKDLPRVHKCGVCGKGWVRVADLDRHMRVHTGEKPYACEVEGCGYRTARRDLIKVHRRVHTGERPFACPVDGCGYRASHSSLMKTHLRTHTGEKPYACDAEGCDYRTASRPNLGRHIVACHGGERSVPRCGVGLMDAGAALEPAHPEGCDMTDGLDQSFDEGVDDSTMVHAAQGVCEAACAPPVACDLPMPLATYDATVDANVA